jgi:hypothetical protein
VDDVVIKTRSHDEFFPDLEETFNSLRKFLWKLNPTKCIFGMPQGKLLGFIISHVDSPMCPGLTSPELFVAEYYRRPSTSEGVFEFSQTPS